MARRGNEKGKDEQPFESEEFGELLKFTFLGYIGGLLVGFIFDHLGLSKNPFGQWLVRTLAGEGESIFEGIYALKKRFEGGKMGQAEAYGWGKAIGMTIPWFVDLISRLLGVNVYGVEGFYIPYFYAMSDQIGATFSTFIWLWRREKSFSRAAVAFLKNPVAMTSAGLVVIVPVGLLLVRLAGFSPTTQVLTAIETIVANLCWLPPLVGKLTGNRRKDKD